MTQATRSRRPILHHGAVSVPLPIHDALPELRTALERARVVLLEAPPGAGKSTALPLALLHEPWMAGQSMLLLQPRRVAARAVASRLAEGLGERVGETVGYRVRFEAQVSSATLIEVVTEGILTRRLQSDPGLEGVGLVLLDEFHERSLNADLAYALLREVQDTLRPDLRVMILSATLEPGLREKLEGTGGGASVPLIRSLGRPHPVQIRHSPQDPEGPLSQSVARAVGVALAQDSGDVLAFLPGVSEIRRTAALLEAAHPQLAVLPLYGDLPLEAQRRALLPLPGQRRVVLATSIAETSLTLEGVRIVVDGGYGRYPEFDPGSGLTRLVTRRVSQDSATQRAGRAGREAPGVAYRLWSERTHAFLPERRLPELLEADLTPLRLELAGWGTAPQALAWVDPPPARALERAETLLAGLNALEGGRITARGRRMLELPTHPRLAELLLEGVAAGQGPLACDVAALLEERDPTAGESVDLGERVEVLRRFRAGQGTRAERPLLERIERLALQWRRLLRVPGGGGLVHPEALGELIAHAYPERVAQLRPGSRHRYKLSSGRGVLLSESDPLAGTPLLAVAHLDGGSDEGRIFLAAPLHPDALEGRSHWSESVRWDEKTGTLLARAERRYGALILEHKDLKTVSVQARTEALLEVVQREGLDLLNWSEAARQWQARVLSLRHWRPEQGWPEVSEAGLLERVADWLAPALEGVRRREDFARIEVLPLLGGLLQWPLPQQLEALAPTHLTVPSGHRVRLEYAPDGSAPVLAVKLQEMFGQAETPTVNGERTPVLLHLLSPARRPVQVTQDLRSFWQSGYFAVRKELRGDYPRHPWPDDPWTAPPTRAVKPRPR